MSRVTFLPRRPDAPGAMRRRRAGPLAGAVLCLAPLVASGASPRPAAAQGVRPSQLTSQTRLRVHEPGAERPVEGTFVFYRPGRLTYMPEGAHDQRSVDPAVVPVEIGRWEGGGSGLYVIGGAAAGGLLAWELTKDATEAYTSLFPVPLTPHIAAMLGAALGVVVASLVMPKAHLVWEPLTVGSRGADRGEGGGADMEVVTAWRPVIGPSPVAPGATDVGVRWTVR